MASTTRRRPVKMASGRRRGPAAGRVAPRAPLARTLERRKLKPIEAAVLRTLPESPAGISFDDLVDHVASQVNPLVFPLRKTVSRYTKVVQLDLERRGLIERIPGVSPLKLRRPRGR